MHNTTIENKSATHFYLEICQASA